MLTLRVFAETVTFVTGFWIIDQIVLLAYFKSVQPVLNPVLSFKWGRNIYTYPGISLVIHESLFPISIRIVLCTMGSHIKKYNYLVFYC